MAVTIYQFLPIPESEERPCRNSNSYNVKYITYEALNVPPFEFG